MAAIRGLNPHYRLLAPTVHGGGRRPEKPFTVDPAELKEWNRCQERAKNAYYLMPNACTRAIWKGGW